MARMQEDAEELLEDDDAETRREEVRAAELRTV